MDLVSLAREVVDLRARNMAQRQIIARLIAYVALQKSDPRAVLKNFAEAGDDTLDQTFQPENEAELALAETIRREKDYLLRLAALIVASLHTHP